MKLSEFVNMYSKIPSGKAIVMLDNGAQICASGYRLPAEEAAEYYEKDNKCKYIGTNDDIILVDTNEAAVAHVALQHVISIEPEPFTMTNDYFETFSLCRPSGGD